MGLMCACGLTCLSLLLCLRVSASSLITQAPDCGACLWLNPDYLSAGGFCHGSHRGGLCSSGHDAPGRDQDADDVHGSLAALHEGSGKVDVPAGRRLPLLQVRHMIRLTYSST